ncbi:hypothetical protein [Gluconacetobacter asukensis]|uniref:Pentapeptide MXKDX repeat protein n=1 Tax=Gluconacetobacter asukensis TaxID=1017181 RepID=A0A7W4NZ69_9PROT|nr:hypothetical protein [Gluconacetobacter asukensis]MBB2171686.1 hypothetical protein [Gluconacetobacter asukensis]
MRPSIIRTALPLAALLAGLHAAQAAAQGTTGTAQGMSGMAGMDMSGMDHGSMSMKGPMETMPGMQMAGPSPTPDRTANAAPQGDCRAMPGMAMQGGRSGAGCGTQGAAANPDPQPMPEAVRER